MACCSSPPARTAKQLPPVASLALTPQSPAPRTNGAAMPRTEEASRQLEEAEAKAREAQDLALELVKVMDEFKQLEQEEKALEQTHGPDWRTALSDGGGEAEAGERPTPLPANAHEIGAEVEIHGLVGMPQHNGLAGTVMSYDPVKDRYVVQQNQMRGGTRISLLTANLKPVICWRPLRCPIETPNIVGGWWTAD